MKRKALSFLMALSLLATAVPAVYAAPEEDGAAEEGEPVVQTEVKVPSPSEAYKSMMGMQEQYPERTPWSNSNQYTWHGGTGENREIANIGAGCVGFAYILSDAAFGDLKARMLIKGAFTFEDVRAGDILRVNDNTHSVIVLRVFEDSVEVAEGNYHENGGEGFIHWGRVLPKAEVEAASSLITRYPVGYVAPDDPEANKVIDSGVLSTGLKWTLTGAGTLTISGTGAIPDFNSAISDSQSDCPWDSYRDKILSVKIEDGVTGIGSNAFRKCAVYSISIPDSVVSIGDNAIRETKIVSASLPNGIKTIGGGAFYGCTDLTSVHLPASVTSIGSGAFSNCKELESAVFDTGSDPITMKDSIFMECWGLSRVILPQNMESIGDSMFMNCHELTKVTIPSGVTEIGQNAFSSCKKLTVITIPASVSHIGVAALAGVPLTDVYFGGSESQWASAARNAGLSELAEVHCGSTGPVTKAPALALSVSDSGGTVTLTAAVSIDGKSVDYAGLAAQGLELVWTRDGVKFINAKATYTVQESDRGKAITARLIPTAGSDYTEIVSATGDGPNLTGGVYRLPSDPGKPDEPGGPDEPGEVTVPGAPTGLTASAGNGSVTLRWSAPAENGGAEITGYQITVDDGRDAIAAGAVTSYTVSGLTNGKTYSFTVAAVNSAGTGAASAAVSAVPAAGSSSSSSSSSRPSRPVTPSVDGSKAEVTPTVSGTTAAVSVNKSTADRLIAAAGGSEDIRLTVSVPKGADVSTIRAELPASALADMAAKTEADLVVQTPAGTTTLPHASLSALGASSGSVSVVNVVNADESVTVEVRRDGAAVGALDGGMKVQLPAAQTSDSMVAVLVAADGSETVLPKSALNSGGMAVLLDSGSATIKLVDRKQNFADTSGHWASSAIDFVSSRSLFQGMENNSFQADVPMNRAMLVTVLHRLESTPAAGTASFDDVPADSYYAAAAAWAAEQGIVTGDGSGFSGTRSVTREEMAVMLYRYVQTIPGSQGTLGSYAGMGGSEDVSAWAEEAMRWAVGSGILSGDDSGDLKPGSSATRGEVAQMLTNFVKLITN